MKALTLQQPWAQLVALGVKTIETRSWSTKYRGRLLIHAGAKRPRTFQHRNIDIPPPMWIDQNDIHRYWEWFEHPDDPFHGGAMRWQGPLGAIVAVCDLVDVVPILEPTVELALADPRPCVVPYGDELSLWRGNAAGWGIDDQLAYGDFTPGRFAWILDNIEPLYPMPAKGKQGLWNWEPGS